MSFRNSPAKKMGDYLFGLPKTRNQYYFQSIMSDMPGIGSFYKARDKVNYMDDYLKNRGLSYGDIKYPTRTDGYGIGGASFVSNNVKRLYR